jgi:hypothetical protein
MDQTTWDFVCRTRELNQQTVDELLKGDWDSPDLRKVIGFIIALHARICVLENPLAARKNPAAGPGE